MSKTNIVNIGEVKIPLLDYAVSCNAILGIRDSGKTVTAKGIAEQLLDHDIPIVVFDAVGKWRWMKVPGPGPRGRGYKVVVAGGRSPDLALNPHSVSEIVRSAVKERIPLIIDLYDPNLSKADWRKIVQQSIRIIHYEAVGVAHVFLEEAAEYIPQKVTDTHTYAEVEKLARMGGNASVGLTLISPRSQEINKAVLDLAHNLVLGCQIGNRAIDSIGDWVDKLSPDTAKALTTSLPHLKSGQAWVWTRTNPDDPKREQMQMCRSLHPDRRTPEVVFKSAKAVDPDTFVKRLKVAIPKIIEETKANDPKELQKKVRELEGKLKQAEKPAQKKIVTEIKTVEKRVVVAQSIARLEKLMERADEFVKSVPAALGEIRSAITEAKEVNRLAAGAQIQATSAPRPAASPVQSRPLPRPIKSTQVESNGNAGGLDKFELTLLRKLADRSPVPTTRSQLFALSGFSIKSSNYPKKANRLVEASVAEDASGGLIITDSGRAYLGDDYQPAPSSGAEALRYWIQKLPAYESGMLSAIADAGELSDTEISERTGRSLTSSAFPKAVKNLKELQFIDGDNPYRLGGIFTE